MNVDVMICAGGKSGSETLKNTLQKNGYRTIKFHNHGCYKNQFGKDEVIKSIKISSKNKKLYMIDSYRLPIERKISSFFQNQIYQYLKYEENVEEIIKIFNNKYLQMLENLESIDIIFNDLKIPKFKVFNFDKRYNFLEKDNIIFIKLRFKDINNWGEILSEIFNKKIIIKPQNLTKDKKIYTLYKKFLNEYKVPKSYLEIIKKNKDFILYNTFEEQKEYIRYWESRSY